MSDRCRFVPVAARLASLVLIATVALAAVPAGAADSDTTSDTGASQSYECDPLGALCTCKGGPYSQDCRDMFEKDGKCGRIAIVCCDPRTGDCECLRDGDCSKLDSTAAIFRFDEGGSILESPDDKLLGGEILEGPSRTSLPGGATIPSVRGATIVGNTATANVGWRFVDHGDGTASIVPTADADPSSGGKFMCYCAGTCGDDGCTGCPLRISGNNLSCGSTGCPQGSACTLTVIVDDASISTRPGGESGQRTVPTREGTYRSNQTVPEDQRKPGHRELAPGERKAGGAHVVGEAPMDKQVFLQPKENGKRLDWCHQWGAQCGEPAASAWCRSQGWEKAGLHQIDPDIGNTWVMGARKACKDKSCDGFKSIQCVRAKPGDTGPKTLAPVR